MTAPLDSSDRALPVAGAAVVCLRGDSVLLVRRGRPPQMGRWSFPGGRIEPGETAGQAARREALEEAGIAVRLLGVVDVYDALFPPYHYCVADYLAEPVGDESPRAGGDAREAAWVPLSEVGHCDISGEMRRVLDRALWLRENLGSAPPPLGVECPSRPLRERVRGLYVITDDREEDLHAHESLAAAALAGGARLIQLRDKRRDAGVLLPAARRIAERCRTEGALFIVNDRIDLAAAAGADGVHLGQSDLPPAVARRMLGPRALIGVSVEDEEQVRRAEAEGADLLGVGPIFGTGTKGDAGHAVGTEQIRRFRALTALPIVAIGGIGLPSVAEVRAAGADAFAVISAVSRAADPVSAARALAAAWAQAAPD